MAIWSISWFAPAEPSSGRVDPCGDHETVFAPGEEITYRLFYHWNFVWLSAGEVVFRVSDQGDAYHLSAHGRTYKSYEWFFKVRDRYECTVDKETFRPLTSLRYIEEGKYHKYEDTQFDFEDLVARSEIGRSMDDREQVETQIQECVHDILSCLYQVRNINLQELAVDTKVPINVYLDKEVFDLDMVYKGQHTKRIKGMGKCKSILLEPEMIVGDVFKKDKGMKIWASDDENRIPLMIESPVSVGSVKAVLKDYSGAKFPFAPSIKQKEKNSSG